MKHAEGKHSDLLPVYCITADQVTQEEEEKMSELRAYEPDEELQELEQMEGQDVPMLDDTDAEYMLAVKRQAEEHYRKMESWYAFKLQQEKDRMARRVAWAENNLRAYFEQVPFKTTKAGWKTYDLPNGKLTFKPQEPAYDRQDDDIVKWLKASKKPELIKIKEAPDWTNLKKQLKVGPDGKCMVTADGEVVPGITVIPQDPKFTVTLK
jgi:hypothetical protein